ncbi:MAG TPA: P63C domain-containing protein [Candidatus Saccharimonadales bacterium]
MGKARARSLSKEERSKIAKMAAEERWNSVLPQAINEGVIHLGDLELNCVVLPDETRIISQRTFLRAIGRSPTLRGGTGAGSTGGKIPFFLQKKVFEPYLTDIEAMAAKPVVYRTKNNTKAIGYNALLLPGIAELYLRLRDDMMASKGYVPARYSPYITASDVLIRGLANVGIIALVDEATGYQTDRAKDALAKIFEDFIAKELQPYVKKFPDEFYENLYRIRGLTFVKDYHKHPKYFGTLTNNIVYERLAPGVLEELKRLTPKDDRGRPKYHLHRHLTEDIGSPKLREHLAAVVSVMKISPDYDSLIANLDIALPKHNATIQLSLGDKRITKSKKVK